MDTGPSTPLVRSMDDHGLESVLAEWCFFG